MHVHCGRSSVGRARASQARCRGFDSLRPLQLLCLFRRHGVPPRRPPAERTAHGGARHGRRPPHPSQAQRPTALRFEAPPRRRGAWARRRRPPSQARRQRLLDRRRRRVGRSVHPRRSVSGWRLQAGGWRPKAEGRRLEGRRTRIGDFAFGIYAISDDPVIGYAGSALGFAPLRLGVIFLGDSAARGTGCRTEVAGGGSPKRRRRRAKGSTPTKALRLEATGPAPRT